jgi:O-antigen ligase
VNLGALFFAAFLITRLTDWWWRWMPSYVFFLVIGLLAIGLIVVFRQLRNRMEARP